MRNSNTSQMTQGWPSSKLIRRSRRLHAPDKMFVSMPEFEFHVPAPLAAPGTFHARAMAVSTHTAWFVLTIRMSEPEPSCETFVLAWDVDVVSVLKSSPGELESLLFVAPHRVARKFRWVTKQVVEIWEATDPSDDSECVLMVAEDGQEHSGYFMERASGLTRRQFVAKTTAVAKRRRDS